jgi:DNA-3-methyladenine glycosylase II
MAQGPAVLRPASQAVTVQSFGDARAEAVRRQVERILSLDVDGTGFPQVAERDAVVARLQAHYPGPRPVCFHSPYEAAAWTVIGRRIRIPQAARTKGRRPHELGPAVNVHGTSSMPSLPRRAFGGGQVSRPHCAEDAVALGVADAALHGEFGRRSSPIAPRRGCRGGP